MRIKTILATVATALLFTLNANAQIVGGISQGGVTPSQELEMREAQMKEARAERERLTHFKMTFGKGEE